jgi:hypothetical protein
VQRTEALVQAATAVSVRSLHSSQSKGEPVYPTLCRVGQGANSIARNLFPVDREWVIGAGVTDVRVSLVAPPALHNMQPYPCLG